MKACCSEGDLFAVPLAAGGFAACVAARVSKGGGVILGYSFGPRRGSLPPALADAALHAHDAALVARVGDYAIFTGIRTREVVARDNSRAGRAWPERRLWDWVDSESPRGSSGSACPCRPKSATLRSTSTSALRTQRWDSSMMRLPSWRRRCQSTAIMPGPRRPAACWRRFARPRELDVFPVTVARAEHATNWG
jgi:hypothetical protein